MEFDNSSFNPSSDIWSQPSSTMSWGDMMKKGLLDKPILGTNQSESKPDKWSKALGKAAEYLAGSGRDKNTRQAQRTPSFFGQEKKDGIGGYQVAPDIAYFPGQSTPGFTVPGAPAEEGWGSTIGETLGAIGGAFIAGPAGAAIGGKLGGKIGGSIG